MTNSNVAVAVTANTDIETSEEMVIVPVRESVAVEIHALLDNIGAAYLKVGTLLNEARADFEAQKEFLAWAEAEFSIKKAQCYNLMNVSRVFDGSELDFSGVAMRVMLALVPFADDADVMAKAAEKAKEGTLDTAAVNELTGKPKSTVVNLVVAGIEQAKAAQAGAQAPESQELQTVPDANDALEWEEGTTTITETVVDENDRVTVTARPLDNAVNADNANTAALLATITQLNQTIADMQAQLNARTSERETRKSAAPMLPQFKSKCLYARLGLSAEESVKKAAINKAKRELVKLGYGEGHEAYAVIEETVQALIEAIPAKAE